jgi:hypothetical protein
MTPYRVTLAWEEVLIAEIDSSQIEQSQQAFVYLHQRCPEPAGKPS